MIHDDISMDFYTVELMVLRPNSNPEFNLTASLERFTIINWYTFH